VAAAKDAAAAAAVKEAKAAEEAKVKKNGVKGMGQPMSKARPQWL
jgi:hypothetical protein